MRLKRRTPPPCVRGKQYYRKSIHKPKVNQTRKQRPSGSGGGRKKCGYIVPSIYVSAGKEVSHNAGGTMRGRARNQLGGGLDEFKWRGKPLDLQQRRA